MVKTFDISASAIIKIILGVIGLYALYLVKDLIIWFLFAFIIAILFNYIIDMLDRKRVPRIIATSLVYFAVFVLIGFGIYKAAPLVLSEIQDFYEHLPQYLKKISPLFEKFGITNFRNTDVLMKTVQTSLQKAGASFGSALSSIFGGATTTALVIAMAFFISLERKFTSRFIVAFSPKKHHDYLLGLWRRARKKVSGWFIARVLGVIFVGLGVLVVLLIFDVKYAVILAVMAGVLDFLPIIGPLVGGILLFTVISLSSLSQAIFTIIAYVIIQQLENHLLFPILFKKFIGMSPVLVLVAFAIGGELWGVPGAILAIPLAGVFYEVIKDYLERQRKIELDE